MKVDICICTFRRPDLLRKTIESLLTLDNDSECDKRIIIIDNDEDESAKDVVNYMASTSKTEIVYFVEKQRGISYARNKAFDILDADFLAFVDDDEIVAKWWLDSLLSTAQKFNADVVLGPVKGVLPENAPRWARTVPAFNRPRKTTGQICRAGGTGNALISKKILARSNKKFDLAFALTGGEDTEFFFSLYGFGAKIVWCDEADVYEDVPGFRIKKKWVYKRSFRGGQNWVRVFCKGDSSLKRIVRCIYNLLKIIYFSVLTIFHTIGRSEKVVVSVSKIYASSGQISILLKIGKLYKEYDQAIYKDER